MGELLVKNVLEHVSSPEKCSVSTGYGTLSYKPNIQQVRDRFTPRANEMKQCALPQNTLEIQISTSGKMIL